MVNNRQQGEREMCIKLLEEGWKGEEQAIVIPMGTHMEGDIDCAFYLPCHMTYLERLALQFLLFRFRVMENPQVHLLFLTFLYFLLYNKTSMLLNLKQLRKPI